MAKTDTPEVVAQISTASIVAAIPEQLSADLADDVVILHLQSGMYYGLDEVGARVWQLIQTPQRVSNIRDILLAEYEVDSPQCEQELLALLRELAHQKLIDIKHETVS